MAGAVTLVSTMRAHNARTWLVTGGFSFFARPVAAKLGFQEVHANDLVIRNGVLSGEVAEPILDRERKKVLLQKAASKFKLASADFICVGDGANDVPMLAACNENGGLGVAYHAKPKVRDAIANQINHGDLSVLLYAQGFRKDEWSVTQPRS
jgi:phosphoserine phosphatase